MICLMLSAARPFDPPSLCNTRCPSSCAASNRLRSAVLMVLRNMNGVSPRHTENASTAMVFSAIENRRTPLASRRRTILLIGFSPRPHFSRNDRAAISGVSSPRSSKSGSGKSNRSTTQSKNKKDRLPAASAASLSFAEIELRLRKLAAVSCSSSTSSPKKKPTGKFSALDRRATTSSVGVIAPDS